MKKLIKDWWFTLVLICIAFIYFYCFVTAEVDGSSMYPTYHNGDYLLVYKTNNIKYGDIVAIDSDSLRCILCKRVLGVEGDHILIDSSGFYRNGKLVDEPYITEKDWFKSYDVDIVVGKNEVFVMGDNRLHSTDSRELGCLSLFAIHGVSIFNFTRALGINRYTLIRVTIILWIVCILFWTFGKIHRRKREG